LSFRRGSDRNDQFDDEASVNLDNSDLYGGYSTPINEDMTKLAKRIKGKYVLDKFF
jgi:hypothetical protein